jgi:nucleotide-binding universal stress UspA family protein
MADTETTKLEASSPSPHPIAVKLRRILVSVYLETSAAIDYALELAKIPGTHFVLLHVIETPRSERNLGAFVSEENKAKLEFRREQALHHLEAVCEKFQMAGALCTANVRIGIPHDEILNEAAAIAPDLIVVGSTATAAFSRFLLGSTAERVVRHATCSVFVARREQA